MNWIVDRAALALSAVALLIAGWAIFRYSGQWVFPVITVIAFALLFADNSRLRRKLRALGVDPRSRD